MKLILFTFMILLLTTSCAKNAFTEFSSISSDDALYEDAKKALNSADYSTAITKILSTSATFQASSGVQTTLASAYAGKCGLDLMAISSGITQTTSSSMFGLMMNLVKNTTVSPMDCTRAQHIMQSFGNFSHRTSDQNLFLAFLGLVKVGSYLKAKADTNSDGLQDSVSIICNKTTFTMMDSDANGTVSGAEATASLDAQGLVTKDMENIITGFGLVIENLTAISATIAGSSISTSITAINDSCTTLGTSCSITDETLVTPTTAAAFRILINHATLGIGTCAASTSDPVAMAACCP